jgi:hypothetical protein
MLKTFGDHVRGNMVGYIALFIALGGTAYAATGGNFILGMPNSASSKTSLSAPISDKVLRLTNTSTAAGATALGLSVGSGRPPFTINSATKVASLNADKLDGKDSSAFLPSGCESSVPGTGQMVKVGPTCIDRYEASVWSSPTGGTQYGVSSDDYPCNDNGQDCANIYARSVAGVTPSRFITWFQAQQALANSGKRLPSNAEWQAAVAGTPDSTACNISGGSAQNTGANAGCISNHGANDMVGNLWEWVGDWVPASTACPGWGSFSDDSMCLSGASTDAGGPGALFRGGGFVNGTDAGPFAVGAYDQPSTSASVLGFRGAR